MLKIGGLLDLRLGLALVVAVGLALVLVFLGPLSPWSIQAAPAISDAAMRNPSPNSTPQGPIIITASADAHGSISPSGTVTIDQGSDQSFAIIPAAPYHIEDVLVDGSSVGAVDGYTFTNVTGNHTIAASFALDTSCTITASADAHGSISPSGAVTIDQGSDQSFAIVPAAAPYHIEDVLVDGSSVGAVSSYTFTNVTGNHTIAASFALDTSCTITASADAHGSISPSGTVTIDQGSDQSFAIIPAAPYHIEDVLVDGSSVGAVDGYTFTNVTGNHTIAASFALDTSCTITASADAHGSISPSGTVTIDQGSDQSFAIVPAALYHIEDVLVDGSSLGAVSSYTFTNVTGNHTIAASFALDTSCTITASADAHSSISPSGTVMVAYGSDQTFSIVPGAHYCINDVLVDGSSVGAVSSYTFTNITGSHTIAAFTSPTLVVAAHDSLHPEGADYVCDGVDDEVQINTAIATLTTTGGVVQLSAGTFIIGANSNIVLKSNVLILGKGPTSTIISKPTSSGSNRAFYADSGLGPYTNIGLSNLGIDMGTAAVKTNPVWASNVNGMLFENLQVVSSNRMGMLYVQHSQHVQILSCLFDGITVKMSGGGVVNDASTIDSIDTLVQGCTFKNSPLMATYGEQFALGNTCNGWRILDNTFINIACMAIDTCNSTDVLIDGNVIEGADQDPNYSWDGAIYSEGGMRVTITNNSVSNCPNSAGIMVSYMIWGYGHGGDILIDNNVVTNTEFGIADLGIPTVTISNNQISHTSWHGVLIQTKTVYGVNYYPNNCTVEGNTISDFGKVTGWSSGIQLIDCQQCQVNLNVINGNNNANAVYGIRESGIADYSTINNNTLSNVSHSIEVVGAHTVVRDNVLQ